MSNVTITVTDNLRRKVRVFYAYDPGLNHIQYVRELWRINRTRVRVSHRQFNITLTHSNTRLELMRVVDLCVLFCGDCIAFEAAQNRKHMRAASFWDCPVGNVWWRRPSFWRRTPRWKYLTAKRWESITCKVNACVRHVESFALNCSTLFRLSPVVVNYVYVQRTANYHRVMWV